MDDDLDGQTVDSAVDFGNSSGRSVNLVNPVNIKRGLVELSCTLLGRLGFFMRSQVTELFYKVKQKPGKPLFFGKKENTQIFALPGNPAAALSCFYVYVYIALQQLMNRDVTELPRVKAKTLNSFQKKGDRPQFLKGIYNHGQVEILDGQNSSMLQTFALSNALVFAPGDINAIETGDTIEVILLPN